MRRLASALALLLTPSVALAGTVTKIRDTGPDSNRLVICILGDGYVAADEAQFLADAQRGLDAYLATPPMLGYAAYVNGYADFVASVDRGADKPAPCFNPPESRDTVFDATFCAGDRRALVVNNAAVLAEVSAFVPTADVVGVVVNDLEYGGTGGRVMTWSVDNAAREIFIHEAGHVFAGLADEYVENPGSPPNLSAPEPNVSIQTIREDIEWAVWIDPATPIPTAPGPPFVNGLYEGARYWSQDIYRPVTDCKMRSLGVPFDDICTEAHIQSMYAYVSPVDGGMPPTGAPLPVDPCGEMSFEVYPMLPVPQSIEASWSLDGIVLPGETGFTLTLDATQLPNTSHVVSATLVDNTSLVRRRYLTPMRGLRAWSTERATAASDEDSDGVDDLCDNCPQRANPGQADSNSDGLGDVCEPCADPANDSDSDSVCDADDNCPADANPDQRDDDSDGSGDACDPCTDPDGDLACDPDDNCPLVANGGQEDLDSDGFGDACDDCNDPDADTICDPEDNCPFDVNDDQQDFDTDGVGDACDPDIDGDGTANDEDCAPLDPTLAERAPEVEGLRVSLSGFFTVVDWDDLLAGGGSPGARYGVTTGRISQLHADRGFDRACKVRGDSFPTYFDTRGFVAFADGYYYLALVVDSCGPGELGRSTGEPEARAGVDWNALPNCP